MTMFPSQNLSKQHSYGGGYGGRGGGGGGFGYDCCSESDLVMVGTMDTPDHQDESRTESDFNEEQEEEAGSSSKGAPVQDHEEQGWLQLGIGSHTTNHNTKPNPTVAVAAEARPDGLVELNLLPSSSFRGGSRGGSGSISQPNIAPPPMFHFPNFTGVPSMSSTSSTYSSPSLYLQNPSHYQNHQNQNQNQNLNQNQYMSQINWAFRQRPLNLMIGSPSNDHHHQSPPTWINPPGSYFNAGPFQVLRPIGLDVAGPSLDFRIIDPPSRPYYDVWFKLQASHNQSKEPFLQQVQKRYLRIKDRRVTVRTVMRYLVDKFSLDNESEVEITCRGEQLLPFLTLQHVRDNIWNPRRDDATATIQLNLESSTTDHIMVLNYARSA